MYQKTVIVGYLGSEPELRFTPSGVPVATFPVAVNRRWTDGNGVQREKTTWFRVTAWRKLAELCNEYLGKGRMVLVEGEIEASAWTDSEGKPRATLDLIARNVRFLGSNGGRTGTETSDATVADEMPF